MRAAVPGMRWYLLAGLGALIILGLVPVGHRFIRKQQAENRAIALAAGAYQRERGYLIPSQRKLGPRERGFETVRWEAESRSYKIGFVWQEILEGPRYDWLGRPLMHVSGLTEIDYYRMTADGKASYVESVNYGVY